MTCYVGLDVSMKETAICVAAERAFLARLHEAQRPAGDRRARLAPQRGQVEGGLVRHVQLEAFRRLAGVADRPGAAVDLAQRVLHRRLLAALALHQADVLLAVLLAEELVGLLLGFLVGVGLGAGMAVPWGALLATFYLLPLRRYVFTELRGRELLPLLQESAVAQLCGGVLLTALVALGEKSLY